MNKLTAQIAAAYYGVDCICTPYGGGSKRTEIGVMVGIGNSYIELKIAHYQSTTMIPFDKSKLLLTPLSKITDDDAFKVYEIIFGVVKSDKYQTLKVNTECQVESIYNVDASDEDKITLYIPHSLEIYYNEGGKIKEIDGIRMQEIIDYLRSKSYDCGYGSIPSLIEAGIAIDKTLLKPQQ